MVPVGDGMGKHDVYYVDAKRGVLGRLRVSVTGR